ncbi:MAG: hypothetical protein ACO2PM_13165 [Pyrobaculum sp.]
MRSRCEVVFLWDFNTFAKLAIFKTVGAGEGPPVVRTTLTRQAVASMR